MTGDDKEVKTTSSLCFNGEDDAKWEAWSFKMLAHAAKKGHKSAFSTDLSVVANPEPLTDEEKANKVAVEGAWAALALVVQKHALKSVIKVRSENLHEAWQKLKDEFEPSQIVDVADLQIEFSNMTFDSHESNPIDWIEKLEANNERVGAIKSEHLKDDFLMIAHVFSQPPKDKHEAHVTSEKKDLANLKLKDMKKSISAHWKFFIKDDEKSDEVFCGEDGKSKTGKKSWTSKKFKGDCRKCGKQGHKAVDCHVKSGNENSSTTGGANNPKNAGVTCHACQAKGHHARDCPNKKTEEFGLFCGMICQEICDSEEENELDGVNWNSVGLDVALAVKEVEAPVEWKFEGFAQLLWEERNADSEADDDDLMPDLFRRNCDDSSKDSLIPELLNRKSCYDSDSDSDDEEPQDFKMNCCVDMLGMWKPIEHPAVSLSTHKAEATVDDILNTGGGGGTSL
jgi:hypothetical protein